MKAPGGLVPPKPGIFASSQGRREERPCNPAENVRPREGGGTHSHRTMRYIFCNDRYNGCNIRRLVSRGRPVAIACRGAGGAA